MILLCFSIALGLLSAPFIGLLAAQTTSMQEVDHTYTLGIQSFSQGNFKQSATNFRSLFKDPNKGVKARYYYALSLEKLNKDKEASEVVEELIAKQGESFDYVLLAGILDLKTKQPESAQAWLKKAVVSKPQDATAHYYLGLSQQTLQQYESSMKNLEKAALLDKQFAPAALYFSGVSYLQLNQPGDAVAKLEKLRHDYPNSGYAKEAEKLVARIEGGEQRSFKIDLVIGGQYDSNVILEPNSINISNEDDFRFYGQLGGRVVWDPFAFGYNFYQNVHLELDDYNVQNHNIFVEVHHVDDYLGKPLEIGVRANSALTLLSNSLDYFNLSNALEPYLRREWSDAYTLGMNFHFQYENFRSTDALRDNFGYGFTFSYLVHLFSDRIFLGVKNNFQLENASQEYDLFRFSNDAQLAWEMLTLQFSAQCGFDKYIYGRSVLSREDNKLTAGASVAKRIASFTVTAGYQHIINDSNIPTFEYDRDIASLNVGKSF
jgi:tetratricopeptide (TPR) repeat protein